VVNNFFKNFTSADIRNFSHKELGYEETPNSDLISYEYAKDLKI